MKKNILFLTLIAFSANLFSQITVNRGHAVVSGQKIIQGYDTLGHALAASGTNVTWDFTDLEAHVKDSLRFGREFWYDGYTFFPKANMGMVYYDDENTTTFMSINDSNVTIYGSYEDGDVFEFETRLVTFPSTYNTSFTNPPLSIPGPVIPVGMDPDSTGPLPTVDSIRFTLINKSSSKMDGWGTMKTPLGDFPALKQTVTNINNAEIEMFVNGSWMTVPPILLQMLEIDVPTNDTSYDVSFWTNDAKVGYSLVSYSYSPGETSTDEVTWNMAMAKGSSIDPVYSRNGFAYPNPVKQDLVVTSSSDDAVMKIYDSNGQLVLEQAVGKQSEISLSNLASGLYMLQVSDAANLLYTQKIVKQ